MKVLIEAPYNKVLKEAAFRTQMKELNNKGK